MPGSGSTREKRIIWLFLPRMPVFRSSARHSAWRNVSPERATEASPAGGVPGSVIGRTVGAGTASTVKGPVTRARLPSTFGWS